MEDLTNIWTIDDELNEEQLLNYLQGNTSEYEAHLIEKQMADDAFVNDAIEGLQAFKSTKNLNEYVGQLNKKLQQQLEAKKQKKEAGRKWGFAVFIQKMQQLNYHQFLISEIHHRDPSKR